MFEWAADLMTRYAHVGDLGKTAVQLIRGSKSSRNVAQFGEKILYKPLKLSGHHRGNMEDPFWDGIVLGMRLRSDEILINRSWCVHCVRGAGRSDAHRRRARQGEEEKEQYMTTWSIDNAFMIDEMERVGWDKIRGTVLVSENLATGGVRARLFLAKGNGDPWIVGQVKDDIEEFGYGGALVRHKSDQEPAIFDVQR